MEDIRKFEQQEERVETGLIQFGDDWPGIFIRGDNAFVYSVYLKSILEEIEDPIKALCIKELIDLLKSVKQN